MRTLSAEGKARLQEVSLRHGVSFDSVASLLQSLILGGGTQAQFNIQELGGGGQWMQGGMTMVGDMFNNGLKARVDSLCNELSSLIHDTALHAPSQSQSQGGDWDGHSGVSLFEPGPAGSSANWWPDNLGHASSVGAQNNMKYAYFPATRRLAIDRGGNVEIFDTLDHAISGFGQQQSGGSSLSFTSQHGLVLISQLPKVTPAGQPDETARKPGEPDIEQPLRDDAHVSLTPANAQYSPPSAPTAAVENRPQPTPVSGDPIAMIERLAGLLEKGLLTREEFDAKKAELLSRL